MNAMTGGFIDIELGADLLGVVTPTELMTLVADSLYSKAAWLLGGRS